MMIREGSGRGHRNTGVPQRCKDLLGIADAGESEHTLACKRRNGVAIGRKLGRRLLTAPGVPADAGGLIKAMQELETIREQLIPLRSHW